MAYNMSSMDSANTIYDIFTAINDTSKFGIVNVFLLVIFLILFISSRNFGTQKALITASAITTLLSILAWAMGWMAFGTIFLPSALLFGSLIWYGLSDSSY